MRRAALACVPFLLFLPLAGCSHEEQQASSVPPEEVLRNAAQASLTLESARYTLIGEFAFGTAEGGQTSGDVEISGVLQDAGNQLQFHAKLGATTEREEGEEVLSADLDVMVGGTQDVFVRINAFTSEGSTPLISKESVERFSGKWWHLPSRGQEVSSLSVTPDPRLLSAQAKVVNVVRDRGMTSIHDRQVYWYDVSIDQEKLVTYLRESAQQKGEVFDEAAMRQSTATLEAKGEIWIDAETYNVEKLQWDLADVSVGGSRGVRAHFSVEFFDHDAVDPIVPPQDAQEFTPLMFFDTSTVSEAPQLQLPPAMEEDMLQKLLEQGTQSPSMNAP